MTIINNLLNYIKDLFTDWRGAGSSTKAMKWGAFILSSWVVIHQELNRTLSSGIDGAFTLYLICWGGLAAWKMHKDTGDKGIPNTTVNTGGNSIVTPPSRND